MKKTILNYAILLVLVGLSTACYKDPHVAPGNAGTSTLGFNLKEFIGIYEAQVLNYVNNSSLVVSRVDDSFLGNQLWIGAQWNGVQGSRVKVDIIEEKSNGDVVIQIPPQSLSDSVTIEGQGTFYYFDNDFFLDANYSLTENNETNNFNLVAVKKVFNQNVIVNISVDCACDCVCNGSDCDCTCTCDD
ncbi:MAG TPA: hypothetical protein DCS93_37935 [Microscillaceae bacterium]|nr:hypothetical protein [Microscillaceae bacterium]